MPWQMDMILMLRSVIGDLDETKYTNERLKQILMVGAYNVQNDADFRNEYTINVGQVSLTPDPIDTGDSDFAVLTVYKSACILIGSEVKTESANAISIKDGPSAIDLRGVSGSLSTLYKSICDKYEDMLNTFRSESGGGFDSNGKALPAGTAILGPYSPGSWGVARNDNSYGYF
jgi:hypothetical protein